MRAGGAVHPPAASMLQAGAAARMPLFYGGICLPSYIVVLPARPACAAKIPCMAGELRYYSE